MVEKKKHIIKKNRRFEKHNFFFKICQYHILIWVACTKYVIPNYLIREAHEFGGCFSIRKRGCEWRSYFRHLIMPSPPTYFSWFFNQGLGHSSILQNNANYLGTLSNWLKPVVQSKSFYWRRCWRASVDGWAVSTFHSGCDNKGPTVTIIKVGRYIFGGYTSASWSK